MTAFRRLSGGQAALAVAAVLATSLAVGASADAHHSFGMFDNQKDVTLTGVVKTYDFKMPHVWFFMTVDGTAENWGMEMGSPNLIVRKGWHINSLKPGDKVTVTMHPMRDGSKAGSVMNVVMPDGKTLMN
jgi:hypothetical protein